MYPHIGVCIPTLVYVSPCWYRYDSDNPLAEGDVGMAGVAIDTVEDMKVIASRHVNSTIWSHVYHMTCHRFCFLTSLLTRCRFP